MNEKFLFFTYLLEKYATYKGKKTKDVLKEWDEKAITKEIYENYFHILSILQNSTDARAISLYHRIYLLEAESGRLLLGEAIAFIYFSFIRVGGGSAYEKAQADARAYKERMGNSYYSDNYGTGKDSNSNSFGYDENGYWYDDDFDF